MIVAFGLLAVAAALLVGGADLLARNAAGAAERLGLSVLAVGVLLAGAEPEELLTAVVAAVRGRPELAVGDALGATVAMLTVGLGAAAVSVALPVGRRVRQYAVGASAAGLLALAALADGRVARGEGLALVAAYAGLVALVWWRERTPPAVGELAEELERAAAGASAAARSPGVALLLAFAGLWVLVLGGSLAVDAAVRLGAAAGVGDGAVGLTALALATSAELVALVWAASRHDVPELAVAGVVGSAAYNATLTLGAAALARPLAVPGRMALAAVVAAALPVAVVLAARHRWLGRRAGLGLLGGYVGWVAVVLALG